MNEQTASSSLGGERRSRLAAAPGGEFRAIIKPIVVGEGDEGG